jgi:N-acetylglucosaminyl-diphospho-decaprenol L-rhamnosyltransferase
VTDAVEDATDAAGARDAPAVANLAAVVVNHDAGDALLECVASLRAEGIAEIVVVDNASTDASSERVLAADPSVRLVRTGENLGYGAGANRGIAAAGGDLVLVSNPDVALHRGAVGELERALVADAALAVVGPCILETDGTRYPSARRFPSLADAAGHAVLAGVVPENRFTRRYRMADDAPTVTTDVDWVSGACFLARRRALEELGGFDETYFMYAEDADLCWRARRAGWGVAYVPGAVVTHIQGVSTARRPYRMLVAHHRSVYRFASRTARGWRRLMLPAVAAFLLLRLVVVSARTALDAVRRGAGPAE